MFSSIRARLWLSYAALIVAALCVVGVVLIAFLLRDPYLYRQTFVRLSTAQSLLVNGSRAPARVAAVADALNVRVVVVDSQGSVLEDSSPNAASMRLSSALLNSRTATSVRDARGRQLFLTKARLQDGSWLLVAAPRPRLLPAVALLTDELSLPLIEGAAIALLLSLFLAYLLARWIGSPLQQLVLATQRVSSSGRPDAVPPDPVSPDPLSTSPIIARGPKEIQELTGAFQAMLARVQASQRSQRDFVANVSHELKTPLTSIQGFAQALLEGAAETPEARKQAAQVIHDEAGRMHRLVLDLLDLARLDAGTADLRMAALDLSALLAGVVERLRRMADARGVALRLTIPPGMPEISGDADRLAQVFTNLVDNGVKFTRPGGEVAVEATAGAREIEVSVADGGPGIAAEDQSRVFDRFFQADSARSGGRRHGAGLGLAIAREIIIAHGGKITLRSVLGKGTTFTVSLPRVSRPRG
jgi:two-component system OmpR family sensor kinase